MNLQREIHKIIRPAKLSRHATARAQQRGILLEDLEVIQQHGEEVTDGYMMTRKAIANRRSELKKELQRLDKLNGVTLIADDDTIVTAYRAKNSTIRRLRAKHHEAK